MSQNTGLLWRVTARIINGIYSVELDSGNHYAVGNSEKSLAEAYETAVAKCGQRPNFIEDVKS